MHFIVIFFIFFVYAIPWSFQSNNSSNDSKKIRGMPIALVCIYDVKIYKCLQVIV